MQKLISNENFQISVALETMLDDPIPQHYVQLIYFSSF